MNDGNVPFYKRKIGCVGSVLIGVALFFVIGLLGSLLLGDDYSSNSTNRSAFDTDTTDTEPTTTATEKEYQLVTTFTGQGDKDTESFTITSDKVKLVATAPSGILFVKLQADDESYLGTTGIDIDSDYTERTAETIYRNLDKGSYYLKVIATKSWKVDVYQEVEVSK